MKKRIFALLLLVTMLISAACSAGAPESEAPRSTDETTAGGNTVQQPSAPQATTAPPGEMDGGTSYLPEDYLWDEDYYGRESYLPIDENDEKSTSTNSMLTFSLKVDTAAYTNVARYLDSYTRPPVDAVRTEELINYFNYDGTMRFQGTDPFAIYAEVGPSPFDSDKYLAFIRVKTKDIPKEELPPSSLTFLIDTSGSMSSYDKLPLLQEAFQLLVENLGEDDTVSIVTYAGSAGVALNSVSGADKEHIMRVVNGLTAGGSTAGANGIQTAYELAEKNFKPNGNNRIILASDGDFNVGISSIDGLTGLISEKRGNGIYLSVLGFGTGNTRDDVMETLAKHGNGNYSYINTSETARKVLVDEIGTNLYTIADDVKAQVEFNPENVKSYRLIGYENRQMSNRDFEDDTKDAGEIGIGTDVVVMFELELADMQQGTKYTTARPKTGDYANELFEVRIRYKDPGESESRLITSPVELEDIVSGGSSDFRFASAVAAFGHILRGSEYAGDMTLERVLDMAERALSKDAGGYRREFLSLIKQAMYVLD